MDGNICWFEQREVELATSQGLKSVEAVCLVSHDCNYGPVDEETVEAAEENARKDWPLAVEININGGGKKHSLLKKILHFLLAKIRS